MRPQGPTFWHLEARGGTLDGGGPGRSPIQSTAESFISAPLDSTIHRCEWHRVELCLPPLPPGSTLRVSTFTDDIPRPTKEILSLSDGLWHPELELVGPMQPPQETQTNPIQETLVQGSEGRYLWLRLRFTSGGHGLPSVRWARVHYPRQTWLEHLPAVYSSDHGGRAFLNRFLAICHTPWQELDDEISTLRSYFDPSAVPPGETMDYLASWLGQRFEGPWTWERKRRLLELLPSYLPRRGTSAALRRLLRVYLDVPDHRNPHGFPRLVESFRERRHLAASGGREGRLGGGRALWREEGLSRLRLGRGAKLDAGRLTSLGDPRFDAYTSHAHRFRIFIPTVWLRDPEETHRLKRAIEREKPAHTLAKICPVEPRLRVGVQATVGLDTLVGAVPRARLADPDHPPSEDRAPRRRLGYDSVLVHGRSGDLP